MDAAETLSALHQQFRSDSLLGLRFLPLPPSAIDALVPMDQGRAGSVRRDSLSPGERAGVRAGFSSGSARQISTATASLGPAGAGERCDTPISSEDLTAKQQRLVILNETQVRSCRKCILCESRTQTVFGQGNAAARLVFVGEGPGFEEDRQGLAFVGPAGQLLTKMIAAMGLTRDDVYICNVVKCRPPQNRTPAPDEIQACNPFLCEQLEIIAPQVIVALGAPASQTLLNTGMPIGRLRGRFHDYYLSGQPGVGPSVPVMPTYHPAYLLRTPSDKAKTWDDLQQVMAALGLKK